MRITLFNPNTEPIVLRVFAYDAAAGSYDESVSITLAPGKVRFFDFKVSKDFVGLGGVIENTSDTAGADAPQMESRGEIKPQIQFGDIVVSSVRSRGSLQHRTSAGQSQTMGYTSGSSRPASWMRAAQDPAKRALRSAWVVSPEY